jgi:PAS domain S-box-containing protein
MIPNDLVSTVPMSRLAAKLVAGALLVNFFMVVLVGLIIYQSHSQYESSAATMTQGLAHVLEENFAGTLDKIDVAMLSASDETTRQFSAGRLDGKVLDTFLQRQFERLPELASLRMADARGMVRYGTGVPAGAAVDISDRKHFQYLKARNDGLLYISEPIFARINKEWVLPVARRINGKDGSFAGIVYALIPLAKISSAFSHLDVGAQGVIDLRDADLNIIARFPELQGAEESVGKKTLSPPLQQLVQSGKDSGTYQVRSALDNIERLYSYRKMAKYPLYVTVGFSADEYLAEWRSFSGKLLVMLFLFALLSSSAIWLFYRGEKRRADAARALQVLNRDFLTLLDNTTDFIYFKDKDSRIRFCSQTLADITGHKSWREMVGKHDREIFPAETARVYQEEEMPVFRDGIPLINRIDPYFDEQGVQGWVSTNKWPVFDADGKTVIGIFGISRDISESKRAEIALRESEQRFRTMFHKHSSIMLLVDPASGKIVDANTAAARFYGYSEDELRGMLISNINTQSEAEIQLERQQALDEQRNYFVFMHRCANGDLRSVEVYSSPVDTAGKKLLFSIVYDITERKKAEDALRRSNADLERFAYSVSHDMRQPLRAISGHLQLLQRSMKDKLDDEERENMNFALEGAKRMDSMIVSLLDYSRVGRKTEAKQIIPSRNSLDEALGFLAPLIAEVGADVTLDGVWPQIFASRDELTRLFQNLIGNAVKFHEPGQAVKVEINSVVQGETWRVSVRDQGVGINPQQMDRLFQFFSRLQSRGRFDGTGMGLALCRRIVEHHNGRIWVESAGEGLGSVFIFELPLK